MLISLHSLNIEGRSETLSTGGWPISNCHNFGCPIFGASLCLGRAFGLRTNRFHIRICFLKGNRRLSGSAGYYGSRTFHDL